MGSWTKKPAPQLPPITWLGWILVVVRGVLMVLVTFGGLFALMLVRLVERPICGLSRPVSPLITQAVCRLNLVILGLRWQMEGRPMRGRGAVVANHASWLDIFVLNACDRVYFVSKSEVAGWPGIGWLARATGTLFINRRGREAKQQQELFEARLRAGHRLLFFPEGTSSDGLQVLPFKSTLFAAFFTHGLDHILQLQPVSVVYTAPKGAGADYYGWWGDMTFGAHFLNVLGRVRQGRVKVVFHAPVPVDQFEDRKALAAHCEAQARRGFDAAKLP